MVSEDAEPAAVVAELEDGEAAGLLISFRREVLMELRVLAIVPMSLLSTVDWGDEYSAGVGYN